MDNTYDMLSMAVYLYKFKYIIKSVNVTYSIVEKWNVLTLKFTEDCTDIYLPQSCGDTWMAIRDEN